MPTDFDTLINRKCSDSVKWGHYAEDVIPLWVADMDFTSPPAVLEALHERVSHGVFGYPCDPVDLRLAIVERMKQRYQWEIHPEDILFVPGVVTALNIFCHATTQPGDGVLIQPPVYHPILWLSDNAGLSRDDVPLTQREDGGYEIDFDRFEAGIKNHTRIFVLCNPHNPVGRVFSKEELTRMAEICLRHGLTICSDEIHCDLIFPGHRHTPIASISPEIAKHTVTLMAPSKTYNLAGLVCSYAIVPDPDLRAKLSRADQGMSGHVNLLGYTAALAALRHGDCWLDDLLVYLDDNRRFLEKYVREELPEVRMVAPEGTYMAWLDCRQLNLPGTPAKFFEDRARVGMNDGGMFGPGGEGFVRLNFGCPRSTLTAALGQIRAAIQNKEN